jgi:hypothetical protein
MFSVMSNQYCLVSENYPEKFQEAKEMGDEVKLTFANRLYLHGELELLAGHDLVYWSGPVPEESGEVDVVVCLRPNFYIHARAYLRADGSGYVTLPGDMDASCTAYVKMKTNAKNL